MRNARFWTVILLLGATAVLLHSRSIADVIPPSATLSEIPNTIAEWHGAEMPIDPESIDLLGPGRFLSRVYTIDSERHPIGLFIAYFPSQRTGVSIHSPKNCLPGAGWDFESSTYVSLEDLGGKTHQVGEYIITDGEQREFVIYWYQAHGRSIANEYVAKARMVIDAMRENRTDGALVRIATPISAPDETAQARVRAESFTRALMPILPRYIPD